MVRKMETSGPDPFARFLEAQEPIYGHALAELRRGRKESHWMWFVFPQLRALGRSERAIRYGIASLPEASAYAAHPVLGARLRECTRAVLYLHGLDVHDIFGSPDDMKFRSSMTLFAAAAPQEPVFTQALKRYFDGSVDQATIRLLGQA